MVRCRWPGLSRMHPVNITITMHHVLQTTCVFLLCIAGRCIFGPLSKEDAECISSVLQADLFSFLWARKTQSVSRQYCRQIYCRSSEQGRHRVYLVSITIHCAMCCKPHGLSYPVLWVAVVPVPWALSSGSRALYNVQRFLWLCYASLLWMHSGGTP